MACFINRVSLVEWVEKHEPSAVKEVVTREVNPAWEESFVGHLIPHAGGAITADGEEVPGVIFTTSKPYVTVRQTPNEKDAILDALRSGVLDAREMLALPEGDDAS
jgi:hypothetical protein